LQTKWPICLLGPLLRHATQLKRLLPPRPGNRFVATDYNLGRRNPCAGTKSSAGTALIQCQKKYICIPSVSCRAFENFLVYVRASTNKTAFKLVSVTVCACLSLIVCFRTAPWVGHWLHGFPPVVNVRRLYNQLRPFLHFANCLSQWRHDPGQTYYYYTPVPYILWNGAVIIFLHVIGGPLTAVWRPSPSVL
jgi:hypothetical protein